MIQECFNVTSQLTIMSTKNLNIKKDSLQINYIKACKSTINKKKRNNTLRQVATSYSTLILPHMNHSRTEVMDQIHQGSQDSSYRQLKWGPECHQKPWPISFQ